MKGKDLSFRLISTIVLCLFLFFQTATHFFVHPHRVDGVTVVHSHPFKSAAHTHTAQQIVSLAQAECLIADECPSYAPIKAPARICVPIDVPRSCTHGYVPMVGRESLPAPPYDL